MSGDFQSARKHASFQRAFFWGGALLLFFAAWGIRLGYFLSDSLIARDGLVYISLLERFANSEDLLSENADIFHVPPLFLLIIRCGMSFGLSAKIAILTVNLFCGAAIPAFVFWLLLRLKKDNMVAISIAGLTVVFPLLVEISIQLLREPLYLFFLFSSATFAVYAPSFIRSRFVINGFFAAFLAACGCFIRFEAIIVAGLLTLFWLYRSIRGKKIFAGMTAWSLGAVSLFIIVFLNFPLSKIFLFFTERMTGVLQ
ncbi:MAG: hypothetical protein J5858_16965 [Lentisphaeria bacterium]|nr:hypothetical protein [Lentisphaeria bacterium]